mgnify:CR=1 FL=1
MKVGHCQGLILKKPLLIAEAFFSPKGREAQQSLLPAPAGMLSVTGFDRCAQN